MKYQNIRSITSVALALSLILIVALSYVYSYNSNRERNVYLSMRSESLLANSSNAKMSRNKLMGLRQILQSGYSDQGLANLYFTQQALLRGRGVFSQNEVQVIKKFGWRNTATQQNLMYTFGKSGDLKGVFVHADALLRRADLIDQLQTLVHLAESDGATRHILADRLILHPNWRSSFLTDERWLGSAEAASDRAKLLNYLIKRDGGVSREEVEVAANALLNFKKWRSAFDLMKTFDNFNRGYLNYSLTFRRLIDSRKDGADIDPFDWRLGDNVDLSHINDDDSGEPIITLHFKKDGANVLLRRLLDNKKNGLVGVSIYGNNSSEDLDALRVEMACEDKNLYRIGLASFDGRVASFVNTTPLPSSCNIIELSLHSIVKSKDIIGFRQINIKKMELLFVD